MGICFSIEHQIQHEQQRQQPQSSIVRPNGQGFFKNIFYIFSCFVFFHFFKKIIALMLVNGRQEL